MLLVARIGRTDASGAHPEVLLAKIAQTGVKDVARSEFLNDRSHIRYELVIALLIPLEAVSSPMPFLCLVVSFSEWGPLDHAGMRSKLQDDVTSGVVCELEESLLPRMSGFEHLHRTEL